MSNECVPHIDLISKGSSSVLGKLAVSAIENLLEEHPDAFTWTIVDASSRSGVKRLQELQSAAGCEIPAPAILVNGEIAFDHIPKMEDLTAMLSERAGL